MGIDQRLLRERPVWAGIAMRFADGTVISYETDHVANFEVRGERRHVDDDFGLLSRRVYLPSMEYTFALTTSQFTMRHFRDWNPDGRRQAGPAGELEPGRLALPAPPRALEAGPPGDQTWDC